MANPKLPITFMVAAAALTFATPAFAGVRTTKVKIGDLDLTNPAAQRQLDERIDRAVRKVCRSNFVNNFDARRDIAQCEANARSDAKAQMAQRIAEQKSLRKDAVKTRLKLASD